MKHHAILNFNKNVKHVGDACNEKWVFIHSDDTRVSNARRGGSTCAESTRRRRRAARAAAPHLVRAALFLGVFLTATVTELDQRRSQRSVSTDPRRSSGLRPRVAPSPSGPLGRKSLEALWPGGLSTPPSLRSASSAPTFPLRLPRPTSEPPPGTLNRSTPSADHPDLRGRPSPPAPPSPSPPAAPDPRPGCTHKRKLIFCPQRGGEGPLAPVAVGTRSPHGNRQVADRPQPADSGSPGRRCSAPGSSQYKRVQAAAPTSAASPT